MVSPLNQNPAATPEGERSPIEHATFEPSSTRQSAQEALQRESPELPLARDAKLPLNRDAIEVVTDPKKLAELLLVHQSSPATAAKIAQQIGDFGDARCVPAISEFIDNHHRSKEYAGSIQTCIRTLSILSAWQEITPQDVEIALLPLLESNDQQLRGAALLGLAQEGHPEALVELRKLRDDGKADPALRLQALRSLPEGGAQVLERMLQRGELPPDVEATALWELYGKEGRYRDAAVHRLNDTKASPALKQHLLILGGSAQGAISDEMIVAACRSEDESVRFGGVIAACSRASSQGPEILREALAALDQDSYHRRTLLSQLAAVGDPKDRALFQTILDGPTGIHTGSEYTYFAKVDPSVALEQARNAPVTPIASQSLLVLAASPESKDIDRVVAALPQVSPYVDLDPVLMAMAERGILERAKPLLEGELAPLTREKLVRALAGAGDPDAFNELHLASRSRYDRTLDLVALTNSPAPEALGVIYRELDTCRASRRRDVAAAVGASIGSYSRFVSKLAATGEPELVRWSDDLVRAKALGIEYPLRFRPEDLHHISETRRSLSPPQAGERQALIVLPRSDHTGAFNGIAPVVESLRERGYRIVLFEASNEKEVLSALTAHSQFGANDCILLCAHGSKDMMSFGGADPAKGGAIDEKLMLDLSDKSEFKIPAVQASLKEGGRVILLSCSTGEGGARAKNMGNMMRDIFPHAAEDGIAAPPIPVPGDRPLEFNDDGLPVQLETPWLRYYLSSARPGSEETLARG